MLTTAWKHNGLKTKNQEDFEMKKASGAIVFGPSGLSVGSPYMLWHLAPQEVDSDA
jgi:hypothetical protein